MENEKILFLVALPFVFIAGGLLAVWVGDKGDGPAGPSCLPPCGIDETAPDAQAVAREQT